MRAFSTAVTAALTILAGQATTVVTASSGKDLQSASSSGRAAAWRVRSESDGELVESAAVAAQAEQPPASSFVTCVSMEQGCTACLGEDIVCPSTMSTGDTASATESTAMATEGGFDVKPETDG